MVRGVVGSLHQGCCVFAPYNGMQCTAMAIVALVSLFSLENVSNRSFTSFQIDDILLNGNRLYSQIVENIGQLSYLSHADLPDEIRFQRTDFHVQYMRDMYYGRINSQANVELGHVCMEPQCLELRYLLCSIL